MAKPAKTPENEGLLAAGETGQVEVTKRDDEKIGKTLARVTLDPQTRNANVASAFAGAMFGDRHRPDITQSSAALGEHIISTGKGDMSLASRIHTSQAISLDAMFTELARRAAMNMWEYPQATERYARLAFKAQANCRATLEALAKLHQPREQTVKHVHLNQGAQAVVADHFHQHAGGSANAENIEQCHATGTAGERASLPCQDASGAGVPISSGERQEALQVARRD